MKRLLLILVALLLAGCEDDSTRVIRVPDGPHDYAVRLQVRECSGRLIVDSATLLIDSTTVVPVGKVTVREWRDKHYAVDVLFGEN